MPWSGKTWTRLISSATGLHYTVMCLVRIKSKQDAFESILGCRLTLHSNVSCSDKIQTRRLWKNIRRALDDTSPRLKQIRKTTKNEISYSFLDLHPLLRGVISNNTAKNVNKRDQNPFNLTFSVGRAIPPAQRKRMRIERRESRETATVAARYGR